MPPLVCWSTVSCAWPGRGGAVVFVCKFNMSGFGFFLFSDLFNRDGYGDGDDTSRWVSASPVAKPNDGDGGVLHT